MIKTSEEFLEGSFKAAQIRLIKKTDADMVILANSMNTLYTWVHSLKISEAFMVWAVGLVAQTKGFRSWVRVSQGGAWRSAKKIEEKIDVLGGCQS